MDNNESKPSLTLGLQGPSGFGNYSSHGNFCGAILETARSIPEPACLCLDVLMAGAHEW